MIQREFDTITKADVEALVINAVAEGRTIEYKQQLPGNSDEEKREFLADVSSFANAGGGDIVYGIVEKRDSDNRPTGIPEKAEGLANINADAEIRRLDDIIRAGIDPRIPGCRIRAVEGTAAVPFLLIRIPKSWASPHMVTFKNLSRFFSRTSAGKYQLDIHEIRSAFTASGDLRARISSLRTDRLGKIIANEAPINLPAAPKIILHLVPLTIFDPAAQIDLQPLNNDPNLAPPIQNHSYGQRFNLDGFLSYGPFSRKDGHRGYIQVFRSGTIEAVDASMFTQPDGSKLVPSQLVEKMIIAATTRYLKTAQKLGVTPPMVVMVTILGLKGYAMATNSPWHNYNPINQIDRDALLLPDVLLEDFNTPADRLLKPVFDAFWQSAGFPFCENYNNQGHWDGGLSQMPGAPG